MYNLKRLRIKKNPLYTQMNLGKIIRYEDIGIVINKDGSLMATIEYRGPDLDSSVEEILAILTSQLNSLFMTLDTGFIFYFEMQRTPSLDYPTKNYFPDEVTKKIDLERRYQFKNLHKNFESRYFLTVYYMPPTDSEQKIKSFVLETKTKLKDLNNYLSIFKANIDKIYRMFIQLKLPLVKMLTPDELATYLHSCVSTNKMNIHLPDRENQKIKDNNIALVHIMIDEYAYGGKCAYNNGCNRYFLGCGNCPNKASYPTSLILDGSKAVFKMKQKAYVRGAASKSYYATIFSKRNAFWFF